MQFRYPKSFLKLLFVGFSLVALPLIFGLVNNAVSIDSLANQSQKAVYQAVQITQASRMLSELITGMERSARQYLVLGDPSLRDAYMGTHEKFHETVKQFGGLPLNEQQRKELDQIVAKEQGIFEALALAGSEPLAPAASKERQLAQQERAASRTAALDEFSGLSELAGAMMNQSNEVIDREVDALQKLAAQAERIVVLQLLALLPVALLLVAGFTYLIARPIAQLDLGIRKLGHGQFASQITVAGPQDLEYLGRQLDWLRMRLIELEEQKARFLRHVSHELKTPLTALREGSELLGEEVAGGLNPQQREIVHILQENSMQLRRLIENLLNYSAVEFHKSAPELKPVKIAAIVAEVTGAHKLAMLSKNLRLATDCADVISPADPDKIRVVIDNLLSNAIKFTPQNGTIAIKVKREAEHAVIDIIDSGPGVALEDKDKVFEPFYQGQAPASGPIKGTGLGLSIAREHVIAHGGRIEIVDEAGAGAHFRVTLPLRQVEVYG